MGVGQNPLPLFSKSKIELSNELELRLITLFSSSLFVVKSGEGLMSIGHLRKCLFCRGFDGFLVLLDSVSVGAGCCGVVAGWGRVSEGAPAPWISVSRGVGCCGVVAGWGRVGCEVASIGCVG